MNDSTKGLTTEDVVKINKEYFKEWERKKMKKEFNEFNWVKIYGVGGEQLHIKQIMGVGTKLFVLTEYDGIYMLQTEPPLSRFQKFIKKIFKL